MLLRQWLSLILIGVVSSSGADYFPAGVLGDTPDQHRFAAEWYSQHLGAMGEPSLFELSRQDSTAETYRFLWLRSFHHPVSVRLVIRPDGTAVLTAKETGGHGGYAPGKLTRNRTVSLSEQRTRMFQERLRRLAIWKLPATRPDMGVDGAHWIVEAVKDGRYHVVDRWSPPAKDPIHQFAITLLDLAEFKLPHDEIY